MNKFLIIVLLALISITAQAKSTTKTPGSDLALSRPGPFIFFHFGLYYSPGYGSIIRNYDATDLIPSIGADVMTRFGYGYNLTNDIGVEFAFADNGAEASRYTLSTNPQITGKYNFDVYNIESALVIHNTFTDMPSDIHAKFGVAYTYGKETLSYNNSLGIGCPSWTGGDCQFQQTYSASGVAPLFDVGFGWSVSKYLAYKLDYEHIFKPFFGNSNYNDPLKSTMQASNMWLLGVSYHF